MKGRRRSSLVRNQKAKKMKENTLRIGGLEKDIESSERRERLRSVVKNDEVSSLTGPKSILYIHHAIWNDWINQNMLALL